MFAREHRARSAATSSVTASKHAAAEPRSRNLCARAVCPCGGGCPRCAAPQQPAVQAQQVSQPEPSFAAPVFVRDALQSRGEPLDPNFRDRFESAVHRDLSGVRVHSGREARAANTVLGSRAFAVGNHIAWGAAAPDLRSAAGERLMRHELTHVAQQRAGNGAAVNAGDSVAEREAQSMATGSLMPMRHITPTRIGVAMSADEYLNGTPYLGDRSPSQLQQDADEISEWLNRQIEGTQQTDLMQSALARVQAELAGRLKNAGAAVLRSPRPKKGKKAAAPQVEADPTRIVSTDDRPRVLIEQSSPDLRTPEARREEVDKIITWLQRTDVSKADRKLLQSELSVLAPSFERDRAQRAQERRVQVIQKAIAMPADGDKTQLLDALGRIDSIRPLAGSPGIQYLMNGREMIQMNDSTVAELRAKVGKALDDGAKKAMDMNNYTYGRASDFIKVNDEHQIVGFVVSEWSGKNPYDMWNEVVPIIQRSNMAARGFLDQHKAGKISLPEGGAVVLRSTEDAQLARHIFNETFDSAMDAADSIVSALEVVRDVSFTVTLALGAAIAAPVIAAGVAGLGATGVIGGGLTILGTTGTVGAGGAVLGGGSTWLAGGSKDEVEAAAWKWGKRGGVSGLGAGTTQVIGAALNVGGAGVSTGSNILRSTAAQAGGNFVANTTGTALEGGTARQALTSGLIGAGTSVIAAPLGAASNSISNPLARTTANMGTSALIGYGTTYALTGNKDEALLAAGTGLATAGLTSMATQPQGQTWGQRRAFELGRGIRNSSRAYLGAAMLGMSTPQLGVFRPGGGSASTFLEAPSLSSEVSTVPSAASASQETTTVAPAPHVETEQTPANAAQNLPAPVQAEPEAVNPAPAHAPDTRSDFDRNVDAAIADDAPYQVSDQGSFKTRARTTGSGKMLTDLSRLPLTGAQLRAAARVLGQRLSGGQLTAWNNTTNAREARDMTEVRRLWGIGTDTSKQQARDLARTVFDRHVGRFWAAVRRDPALQAEYSAAGMRFDLTKSGAPRYQLQVGEETGVTLDHNTRLMDDPTQALSGNNLSAVLGDENSVTLEDIRNNDPFQR
jgi:Domain of unknown function (DUF4157)